MTFNPSQEAAAQRRTFFGRSAALLLGVVLLLSTWSAVAQQSRQEREGVVMYWGLVPEAIVSQRHAMDELHGGAPQDGGQVHHLVVALFDAASSQRLEGAVVRARLSENGIVDAPPKYLPPMPINGQMSYGQLFSVAKDGPYQFRVFVKLSDRPKDIEFAISAYSPHAQPR
jgi:hypothetical protein